MKHRTYPSAIDALRTGPDGAHSTRSGRHSRERGAVLPTDRWLLRRIARVAGDPQVPMALWNGENAYEPGAPAAGRLVFLDRKALLAVFLQPELSFGDAYVEGRIDIQGDLVQVLKNIFEAIAARGPERFKRTALGTQPKPGQNTPSRARRNIHYHYDLGNEFYRLWLDSNMVYTCAYYAHEDFSLEQAQLAKMEHVCRKVALRPGMHVVEAGCGWGSLALYMARHHGASVRAFNISHEQIAFARERARAEGLSGQVEFIEDDFRNITGDYDAFVSIGMLEHVGPQFYHELGNVIRRSLRKSGLGIVHSVGRNRPTPPNSWIKDRIFPGSYVPSLREIIAIFEPWACSILDVENLRLHYAKTLMEWLARFDAHTDEIRRRHDDAFVRAWRLYLGGCAAGFLANTMQLFQVVIAHDSNNAVPMNREHLYREGAAEAWKSPWGGA